MSCGEPVNFKVLLHKLAVGPCATSNRRPRLADIPLSKCTCADGYLWVLVVGSLGRDPLRGGCIYLFDCTAILSLVP